MKRKRSAVLVVVVMVAPMILPMVAGQSLRFPNSTDFGVHAEVAELLQRIEERRTGIDIVQQTEGVLHQIQEQPYDRITLVDSGEDSEDVRTVPFVQPASNEMVDSVLTTPIAGYDSIWDFLINNPLEYYVYYKYADEHHAWVEGSAINPTILPNDLDWTYLDVDDDPSTGTGGNDIRIRFKLEPREVHIGFTPTIIPPQDLFTLDLFGGLAFQVENLNPGPHATDAVPLEVGIAKSISFDGKNYIILLQFVFRDRIPDHYSLSLLMNMYLTDLTWEAIFALLSGNWTDIDVAIDKAVEGPYVIEWGPSTTYASFFYSKVPEPFQSLIRALLEAAGVGAPGGGRYPPEDLPNLDIMAGIGNVTRAEDAFVWREISWLSAHVVPADGDDDGVRDRPFLPGLGNLTLDTRNENTAFESITWFYPENNQTFGYPTDVNVDYFDARDNESLYVRLDIEDMPYWLRLRLINESNDSEVRSRLLLDSSSEIGWLNYTEYLYTLDPGPFPQPVHPGNDFRVMHVELWDVPRHISLRGTFDSGSAPEPDIGGGNLITQFFNAVIAYFYKGFWGVGNTLRSISDRMFNMPADKGWFKLSMRGDHLGGVEFWYTTDRYVYLTPEKDGEVRDFVAFTRSRGESVDTPISGRVRGIGDVKLFFGNDTTIDLEIDGQRAFYFTYIDQNATWEGHPGLVGYGEDATVRIASLPNVINITVTDRTLDIQTEGPRMGDVTFVGLINGTYMLLSMTDFPEGLSLYHFRDRFSLNFTGTLGSLEIAISDDSLARLPGRYILLRRTGTSTMISARITNVSSVMYDTRNGTRFAYELGASYPFYIRVNDTVMATDIRAAVNPLPKSIDLTLTAELGGEAIEVPSVGNISSIFDLSNVLVSLATMGDSVTKMLSNVTQGGLDILKDLGSNDRFDYSSSYNLNIVAEIKVGDVSHLGPVTWTHGVSMRREVIAGETVMHARIYLDGMPKILQLRTYIANDTTELNIAVEHFASRYSWVLLDVEGLMDRDIFLYLEGLQNGSDLNITLTLMQTVTENGLDHVNGTVDIYLSRGVDAIYLSTVDTKPPLTSLTLYAAAPPLTAHLTFEMSHETHLRWEGITEIPRLMLDLGKSVDGRWYHTHVVARSVPRTLALDVNANPEFDMDNPSPLQGLPTVEITTTSSGLSALVHIDGRGIGQQGDLDICAEGIGTTTRLWSSGDTLHVEGDIDVLMLRYSDLPVRKEYQLRALEVYALDVGHLKVTIRMMLGLLPLVMVDARDTGDMRIMLDHDIDIMGKRDGRVVLVDVAHNGLVPGVGAMGMNEITLEGGQEHVLVPDPVSTLLMTLFGGGE